MISKLGRGTVQSILSDMHSELQELSQAEAEHQYLMEAQTLPEYGMVFYQVAKTKHEKIGSVWLGLSVRGIVIYDVHKDIKTPTSHWPWKKIKNLSYAVSNESLIKSMSSINNLMQNKQFFMEVEDHRSLSYYAESYKRYMCHKSILENHLSKMTFRAQYLLHLSINYHRFQLLPLESSGHTTPPSSFPSPQHKEPGEVRS